ncbi:uncharacterized protein LOC122871883 isoform X2 [Siniperca chuatsi]|uniref:uncharacterized protein LOC122871883 isoform X2 n=1 Tax=Siniperca chuatsi TaxID=119488 RepID=UPI001CE080BF|nr:uncharacterized protein LOC122871883 isoform X2 [Siniperca chuatsi]
MLLAEAECVFMSFILYISGVQGRANSICALKGSSVDLPCSAEQPTSSMKWYTIYRNYSTHVLNELSADRTHATYNMSEESNFTLTIKDVSESDEKFYCCRETNDNLELCWDNRTELHVADLQVQVIPTTEGQTVTLMCSTSCPLTENPAAYIWYKNREFLYEDWSPWYQQLVSSDEAVRYSCAIKGYEDLRAPEVSVDSVTPTCFKVTYAKGRMCSYRQTSVDEACSITYPTEVQVQWTPVKDYVTLTCTTSCPTADAHHAYRWYWDRHLYSHCKSQDIIFFGSPSGIFSCAVKGLENLHSDEKCFGVKCWSVNYVSRRICALEGSSVNISSEYFKPSNLYLFKLWNKVKRRDDEDAETLTEDGRVEFYDNMKNHHMLRIDNLMKNDSAEYTFRLRTYDDGWKQSDLPGVTLVVTGLNVKFTPSAVVTEGQRVTLTCSTSCPLTDNTIYIWYLNSRPLTRPENQNKHLVLDPVSTQHAGNYSCAVKTPQNISSPEETLTVKARGKSVTILNAVKLTVLLLILSAAVLLYLTMRSRKRKTQTATAELSDKVQSGRMDSLYESIALVAMDPAAQTEPKE